MTPPPWSRRIGTALRAAGRWLRAGCGRYVTRLQRDARLAACRACECYLDNPGGRTGPTCADCGCKLLLKSWMATEDCPRLYWPDPAVVPPV